MDYKMKNGAMPRTDKTPGERYHEMPEDLLNLIMRMRTAQMVCELLHRYPGESEPEGDDKGTSEQLQFHSSTNQFPV